MAKNEPVKNFDGDELFLLDLFVAAHSGKSWVSFKKTENLIHMSSMHTGKKEKNIEIVKCDTSEFDAEVMSGIFVRAHIRWNGPLSGLLRRMETELLDPKFQEA